MQFLRTNTATRVTVGPFLDKTDGVTPETALTVTSCKLTFVVDDGGVPTLVLDTNPTASGGSNDMVHITGDDAGYYDLELAAANVNYLGRAKLALTDASTHCPVFQEFTILPAMIYDSIVLGTDRLDTNVTHVADTAQTGRDLGASVLLSTGTGTGQLDFTAGIVKSNLTQISGSAVSTTTAQLGVNVVNAAGTAWNSGAIGASTLASDTITDAKVASDVTIASVTGSVGSVTGAVGSVTGAVGSVTGNVGGNVTGSVGSLASQAKADVNAEVVDAVNVDTYVEIGQEAPAATQTLRKMVAYLYKAWRNRATQTATAYKLYGDDATTVDQKSVVADDGTTFDSGEKTTGP
jgi:hypothetical protein